MRDYNYYVEKFNLKEHPEGGFYKETYLTEETITLEDGRIRQLASNIIFLLTATNPSHFHRLKADEIWFYHTGKSLTVHMLTPQGEYKAINLGLGDNEYLQYTVPKGTIFGSTVEGNKDDFSVVSCVVSPAFHYDDFELFTQQQLLKDYPENRDIIEKLAYKSF